jgi:hypothetical protein
MAASLQLLLRMIKHSKLKILLKYHFLTRKYDKSSFSLKLNRETNMIKNFDFYTAEIQTIKSLIYSMIFLYLYKM